jgi:hypothetical protein
MNKTHRRALVVATTTLLGGIAASLAGNLQAINLGDAQPGIGAYISAVLWPVFLFLAIEVMLHTPWVSSWRDGLTKWAGLLGVAFVSFWISYWHMAHVLHAYGYDAVSSHSGPLAVDVTMAMATLALNRVGQARQAETQAIVPNTAPVIKLAPLPPATVLDTVDETPEMDMWTRLEAEFPPGQDIPVPVSPAPRTNEVRPEAIPADAADLIHAWLDTPTSDRPSAGQVDEAISLTMGKTPRTARRWRYAIQDQRASQLPTYPNLEP